MSIHDGHRERMKNQFLKAGLDGFAEVNVLEMLLFYGIPRRDTNPIAHALLNRFGSLANVLEAPVEELVKVDGISESAATYLSFVTAVGRYYMVQKNTQDTILDSIEKCGNYLIPFFIGCRNETVYLLCMDAKCKVLCCRAVSEGSVNAAGISVRKVIEVALSSNATTVIMAHNHPSGLAFPSGEDVQTTKNVSAALRIVDVTLADHIIVSDNDFVSLAQSGYYNPRTNYAIV